MTQVPNSPLASPPQLERDAGGLFLRKGDLRLQGDFAALLPRVRQDRLPHELLVKAARIKGIERPRAVDATAGLGEDAFLLAAAGFFVTLVERNPLVAQLLEDALQRAKDDPSTASIANRMELVHADSVQALCQLDFKPHLVYLDPMFPAKGKAALTKKKLQVLQGLETPCEDEEGLLEAAFCAHPRKIVVKRPLKGPFLAGRKPSHSLTGKTVRYDVIVLP